MPIRKKMLTTTWFRSTESRVRPTSFSKKYLQVFKVCETSSCPQEHVDGNIVCMHARIVSCRHSPKQLWDGARRLR